MKIALILISLFASFQAPPVLTGTLTVRVVERGTKVPLAGVKVTVVNNASSPAIHADATTAPDGTAAFTGLKVGVYEVRTWSSTHLAFDENPWPDSRIAIMFPRVADGQDVLRHFPGSASVRVRPDRRLELAFELPLAGAITGRIVSPGAARVEAFVSLYTTRKARAANHPVREHSQRMKTDADGSFAFRGLARGTYLLTFRPGGPETEQFSEVYYPGVIDVRDAAPLTSSETQIELSPVALRPVPRVRISGRVDDQGDGRRELVGRDLDLSTDGHVISLSIIPVRRNGTFTAPHVDAGIKGLLYTRKARDGALLSAATAVLHVGAEPLAGIQLKPVTPSSISGRFVYERPYEPVQHASSPQIYLSPQGADAWLRQNLTRAHAEKDEGFRLDGIIGTHRIDARAPTGWVVKGVILEDGRNVLDAIFDFDAGKHYANVRVLLSPDAATLEGRVDLRDVEPSMQRVSVFPVDERLWDSWRYQHLAAVDRDGSFRIDTITPGHEYYVATCRWPCGSREGLENRAKSAVRIVIDRAGPFRIQELKR